MTARLIPTGYLLIFLLLFYAPLHWLVVNDWSREDFNYAYIMPAVILYLIWEKRAVLGRTPSRPDWLGLVPVLVGLALFWLGELSGEFFSIYVSLWLLTVGACWLHLGWPKLKLIAFPLALGLTMFPPPHFLFQKITFSLKLVSSALGVQLMQLFGMSAFREGNIIDLGFTQLQVVDACSGLRYLLPLIVLGLLLAYFFKGAVWKKIVLVMLTVPLTVFTNSLRIALTGLLSEVWGPEAAKGFFHDFSGWFIFMFSFVVMLGIMRLLKHWPRGRAAKPAADSKTAEQPGAPAQPASQMRRFVVMGGLLLASLLVGQIIDFRPKVPISRSLDHFPVALSDWHGRRVMMERQFVDMLDLSDYAIVDYRDAGDRQVNFYVAYYENQNKGASIHSPATCLPGSGWEFQEATRTQVAVSADGRQTVPVNRALMIKGGHRRLAYYWFPMRGRVLTTAYQMKWYNFWDALTRRRTDGALVRLITPVGEDETVQRAEQRLAAFTRLIVPVLTDYLPQ